MDFPIIYKYVFYFHRQFILLQICNKMLVVLLRKSTQMEQTKSFFLKRDLVLRKILLLFLKFSMKIYNFVYKYVPETALESINDTNLLAKLLLS